VVCVDYMWVFGLFVVMFVFDCGGVVGWFTLCYLFSLLVCLFCGVWVVMLRCDFVLVCSL